jgi:hypothetical protein
MAQDPAFLFYPGDYLRDTQCLSENAQVAYDRIMCEHMRKICISQDQLNFFTKRLTEDEKNELLMVLNKVEGGYQIAWVAESICKRKAYSESRRNNRAGKLNKTSLTYDKHMENEIEIEDEKEIVTEKKKKPKKSEFVPPELNEVEVFFQANGFSRELGEKAFRYYADADWKDSKGNKVLNWKQKMRGVWFKDENKNNGQQQQTNRKNTGGGFTDQEIFDAVARHHGIDNFGTQEPR